MFCDECSESCYLSACSEGTCKICYKSIFTGHIPPYEVCRECSDELNLCQQCGKEV